MSSERRRWMRFDKVFPVYLSSDDGVGRGIARNISTGGMFIEAREPFPLGTRMRVTFVGDDSHDVELTVVAEVRYQCFLCYGNPDEPGQIRGMGIRFVGFEKDTPSPYMPARKMLAI